MSRARLPACHGAAAGPGFPPRGGDERDRRQPSLLEQELIECLREQLPRVRRGDAFAPEVVLEFVRSITELQGDDFKERGAPPERPPAEATQTREGKHILDLSLEALNCDPVPVLLPLVVSPRGASDTAVANSNGSWKLDQRRCSAENAQRRLRLRSQPSSEGDHERAVIAEALKDIRRRLDPSPQESSEETPGPSELEELMEDSSLATTSEDTSSSQDNTGEKGGDSTSAETTEVTEQLDIEDSSEEQSAASAKDLCPTFPAAANYDVLSSAVSCLDPVVDHVEPLYTMRNVYQNIAQAYDTVFGSAQVDAEVPLFLDENPKQPADSCSACYDFTNHEYLTHHERLPGGAFERFISSSHQSDADVKQRTVPRVPDLLCGDDCHFQSPHVVQQFQQVPLNAELHVAVQQPDGVSGSSMIPSVDEKSFINFLFSTLSNDDAEGRAGQLDPFQINSNVGFLNENADAFSSHVSPAVIADYNNNVFGFHDNMPGYQELATIDETERQAEVSGETQVGSTMRKFSEPTENSTSATSTETSCARNTPASPRPYQPTFEKEIRMTGAQVFQVELSNMAPEFLQLLQDKNDDVNAEKGHVLALSTRICDVLSTEPERNYDLLKSSPERCSWAKARTPFSDANALAPAAMMIPVAEEALKLRRRNGRNFFSDGHVLGDAISGGQAKHQEHVLDRPKLTSWPLKPAFITDKDWIRRFAPLRPMFVREQRQPKQPPPLKPVFLGPQQQQRHLHDWTDSDTAARPSVDGSLGWANNVRLPPTAPSCLTDDEVNTEDIVSGLREDTAILKPLLLESRNPIRQQLMTTESSSSDDNNSDLLGPFGTSSSDDNNDSCTATSLNASEEGEDSARTSTTATSAPPPQHRSLHHATFRVSENNDLSPDEPQAELLAPLPAGGVMTWRTSCSAPSATDEAEFDGSVPLFDCASAASEETAEVGGFNEVYPGSTKKTITIRAMMPTIDEEDQE